MITIEHLEVLFDAQRERDEARFAELFARYATGREDVLRREADLEARAQRERAITEARSSW